MYHFTKTAMVGAVLAAATNVTFGQTSGDITLVAEKPRCILVQLPSESNRITALIRGNRLHDVGIVKTDAEKERAATISDFTENFDFCPVYFYIDTNVQRVKSRKFEGILIDTAGNVVAKPLLDTNSKDYLVTYFGFPENERHNINDDQNASFGKPAGKALVIFNYRYQQLNYISKRDASPIMRSVNHTRASFGYSSKKFDIEYYPLADELNHAVPRIYEIQ